MLITCGLIAEFLCAFAILSLNSQFISVCVRVGIGPSFYCMSKGDSDDLNRRGCHDDFILPLSCITKANSSRLDIEKQNILPETFLELLI